MVEKEGRLQCNSVVARVNAGVEQLATWQHPNDKWFLTMCMSLIMNSYNSLLNTFDK